MYRFRKLFSCLLVVSMIFCLTLSVSATTVEPTQLLIEEQFKNKFKEIFPDYIDTLEECDTIAALTRNGTMPYSSETERVIESVTRYEGDDKYTLTLYSDGGYSEIAVLSETVTTDFNFGSLDGTTYINCTVSCYLSDPGLITYTGGIYGENISIKRSGSFKSGGYGSYVNWGVDAAYNLSTYFIAASSSSVSVRGVATGYLYVGNVVQETLTKETELTITPVPYSEPQVTFGYA